MPLMAAVTDDEIRRGLRLQAVRHDKLVKRVKLGNEDVAPPKAAVASREVGKGHKGRKRQKGRPARAAHGNIHRKYFSFRAAGTLPATERTGETGRSSETGG